jgi:hypothetical protein
LTSNNDSRSSFREVITTRAVEPDVPLMLTLPLSVSSTNRPPEPRSNSRSMRAPASAVEATRSSEKTSENARNTDRCLHILPDSKSMRAPRNARLDARMPRGSLTQKTVCVEKRCIGSQRD